MLKIESMKTIWWIIYLGFQVSLVVSFTTLPPTETPYCRDRFGLLGEDGFIKRSCSMCYMFLFPSGKNLIPLPPFYESLIQKNRSNVAYFDSVSPHPHNQTSLNVVCSTLTNSECSRWKGCCTSAMQCCNSHLQITGSGSDMDDFCPPTWDGFACWGYTVAGQEATQLCPDYIANAPGSRQAVKQCTDNATWFAKGHLEWTDYTSCLDKKGYLIGVYIALTGNAISLIMLSVSVCIFIGFRELRQRHRVQVHTNFFISLMLRIVCSVLWFTLVHHDILVNNAASETVFYENPVWCRILSILKIYTTSTTYSWMFCEGYYLHRLITNAFRPPHTLALLYVLGWVIPAVPSIIYVLLHIFLANDRCWVENYKCIHWIIFAPNLCCLLINLFFLCNILRILVFQLRSHPHEPGNFRRAIKATFMLIPLFGLQLLLTIYRPPVGATGGKELEYIYFLVNSTQGIFVSLIFCFINGEVLYHLRSIKCCCGNCSKCCCANTRPQSGRPRGQSTQLTQITLASDQPDWRKVSVQSRDGGKLHIVNGNRNTGSSYSPSTAGSRDSELHRFLRPLLNGNGDGTPDSTLSKETVNNSENTDVLAHSV